MLFLAAEALRGCGGVLLDCEGNRFANELGRRDYVSNRMFDCKKGPYRLCLNSKASKEIEWHCKHYKGRGLMKAYNNMGEFAKEHNIPLANIEETFKNYNEVAKKQAEKLTKPKAEKANKDKLEAQAAALRAEIEAKFLETVADGDEELKEAI